jgi:predicted Zn finger-like uncharacterized protein
MKFVCDRCHTRYSISDEKVRGKVLKIRCKTCSNIIVVREQTSVEAKNAAAAPRPAPRTEQEVPAAKVAAGGAAPRPPRPAPAPSAPVAIEWFVAIKGAQHGPMPVAKVEDLYKSARLSARSYVWHEGLPKWTRMRDLPEFATLIASPQAAAKPKPPPPPPEDVGGEVVDFAKARQEREAKSKPGAVTDDPFGLVPDAAEGPLGPTTGSSSAPKESTRVFIMNAGLANRKVKHRAYGAVAIVVVAVIFTLGALDWMGTYEVPVIHSLINVAAETAGIEAPATRVEKEVAVMDDELSDLEAQLLKCELQKIECPSIKNKLERKRKKKRKLAAKLGDDLTADMFQKNTGSGGDLTRRAAGSGGELATFDPSKSDSGKADEIKNLFENDMKKKFKPLAKIETPAVSGGVGLSAKQIGTVVKDNRKSIEGCIAQASKSSTVPEGKQMLVLNIENTGKVSKAKFDNAMVNTMPIGQCLTKRARKWRFPAFEGAGFEVEIPLVLGVRF